MKTDKEMEKKASEELASLELSLTALPFPEIFAVFEERREQVPFSMAKENCLQQLTN